MNKSLKNTRLNKLLRSSSPQEHVRPGGGSSQNFPWTHASFHLTMASERASTSTIHLKTQREGEQACPYADGVFNRDTNTGGNIIAVAFMNGCSIVYTHSGTYRWGGNRGMFNYLCISSLPAFSNSFLRLNSCNSYYQSVYS